MLKRQQFANAKEQEGHPFCKVRGGVYCTMIQQMVATIAGVSQSRGSSGRLQQLLDRIGGGQIHGPFAVLPLQPVQCESS